MKYTLRRFLIVAVLMLTGSPALAEFTVATIPGTAFENTTTTVVWENTATGFPNDDDKQLVPIGFNFNFGGVNYNQVRIISNGFLHFGADQNAHQQFNNQALPSGVDRIVSPYWDDLNPGGGGTVTYDTLGAAPNRRFVATWLGVPRFGSAAFAYSFQVVLFENGNILFRYGNDNANGASATIGIEEDNADFNQFSFNTASVSDAQDLLWTPVQPAIVSVANSCDSLTTVRVSFADTIAAGVLTNPANYSLDGGAAVTAATLLNASTVQLTATGITAGLGYTLLVNNPATTVNFFAGTDNFIDSFLSAAYTNNGGSENWTGNWQEQQEQGGGGGPAAGNITIANGQLRMDDQPNTGGQPSLFRELDLSGYITATLTYDYQTSNNLENGDLFDVEVSDNGGASYTRLVRYANDVNGSASFDISGFMSANTRIRFRVAQFYGGGGEAMQIDNVVVTAREECADTTDHFRIESAATAINCQPQPVRIIAQQSDDSTDTAYTGTVTLSTSTGNGDWLLANGTSIATGSDTGNATYTFVAADNGVVDLLLRNTNVESLNMNVSDGTISETTGAAVAADDPTVNYAASGFRFYDGNAATPIATQLSGKNSNVLDQGLQSDLFLQAVNTNSSTGACEALLVGNQNITLSYECLAPNTCSAALPTINGTAISEAGSVVALDFGNNTQDSTSLIVNYPDAGRIRLNASFNLAPSGTITGSSNPFVVKPAGFCLQAQDMDGGGPRSPDCASNDSSCSVYVAAGDNFTLSLQAKAWQSAGETGSALCDNPTTVNFVQNAIALSANTAAPVGGDVPLLTPATADITANGAVDQSFSADEVGVFIFTATVNSYLGEAIQASSSSNVGRFIPHHFAITPGTLTAAVGTAANAQTYLGQSFTAGFTLQAMAADGTTVTRNYQGSFAKPDNPLAIIDYGAADAVANVSFNATRLDDSSTVTSAGGSWQNGSAIISSLLTIDRAATPDGPFTAVDIGVIATDSDGVSLLPAAIDLDTSLNGSDDRHDLGQLAGGLRYGRVFVPPVYGPETNDGATAVLAIPFELQYFNGSAFVVNADDNVSDYGGWTASCADADGSDGLVCAEAPLTVPASPVSVAAGRPTAAITIGRPGVGNTGSLNITLDVEDWLEYDWNVDGSDDDPVSRVSFGSYRSNDRIIYWRERN